MTVKAVSCLLVVAAGFSTQLSVAQKTFREVYPPDVVTSAAEAKALETAALQELPKGAASYLQIKTLRWVPGYTVTVAFNGGTPTLHKQIADVASKWNGHANIKLDFGYDSVRKTFRTWSPNDASLAADVRIGFVREPEVYWSTVGKDSMNRKPSEKSMCLGDFHAVRQLPENWRAVVLHEFGHALGFDHEHQTEHCRTELDWDLVYDYFSRNLPVEWDVAKKRQWVEVNLGTISAGKGDLLSPHDRNSIMHYTLPVELFRRREESPCYIMMENSILSAGDIAGLKKAYPPAVNARRAILARRKYAENFRNQSRPQTAERELLDGVVAALNNQAKPRVFIFIIDESQRLDAEKIKQAAVFSFAPLGIQRVPNNNPKQRKIQVRHLEPEDEPVAEEMKNLVASLGVGKVRRSYTLRSPKREKRGDIEVWFPPPSGP